MTRRKRYEHDNMPHPDAPLDSFGETINKAHGMLVDKARSIAAQLLFSGGTKEDYEAEFHRLLNNWMVALVNAERVPGELPDLNSGDIILTREFFQSEAGKKMKTPLIVKSYGRDKFIFGYIKSRHHNWTDKSKDILLTVTLPLTMNGYNKGLAWLKEEIRLERIAALDNNEARWALAGPNEVRNFKEVHANLGGWTNFRGLKESVKL